jgi:REP element-mobilizing transposase RayT
MARPLRLSGVSYVGRARYFLTFCTDQRTQVFRDPDVARMALAQFRLTARLESFAILAYCLMPDHVHLLVEALTDRSDLRRFSKMAKQRSGAKFSRSRGKKLWQEGYFERILREEDDAKQIAVYIIHNPVRAGLVTTAEEYPHLGSDVWPLRDLIESVMW